jgi:DNA-binding beta-propeller fold protein YncE
MVLRATLGLFAAAAVLACNTHLVQAAPYMIVGIDQKQSFDNGKAVLSPPGKDSVLIVDLANPLEPKIVASLPLKNSVVGPPVNLDIDPTDSVALVADSINVVNEGGTLKSVPDNKIYVIDLKSKPAKLAATIAGGKQASGLSINPAGNLALVANRGDKSITVLSINGADVKIVDTVPMGDEVSSVVFTADGKRAVATKNTANKIAILDVAGSKVTYNNKLDILTGLFPYNVVASPNGQIALTADNGNNGSSDGNVDTVSVIDLSANPPRVIDHITVPDSPEGMAFSPRGNLAASASALGSNKSKQDWFYHPHGVVTFFRVDGKKVTRVKDIEVGALPEAICFTPDGRYLYAGNYMDDDFSILRVNGTNVTDTGKRFKVPGQPASARMSPH